MVSHDEATDALQAYEASSNQNSGVCEDNQIASQVSEVEADYLQITGQG
jgi:hypothetical protein